MSASTMTGSHVTVALCNSASNCEVAVLTVHVVGARTRVITQPDAEVLDLQRRLLELSFHRDDLTSCLLELTQLTQEVPKSRLGDDMVRCEDDHFEERRIWILLGWQLATDDLILLQLKRRKALVNNALFVGEDKVRSS